MNRQAWIDITSDQHGKSKEIGFCDLNKTLSLFDEFERYDRAACPTLQELEAEDDGDGPFGHDHLDFDVCFGHKNPGSQEHSNCYVSVSALKPSGYAVHLTVPRYWMGFVPIPKSLILVQGCRQYCDREGAVITRDQVAAIIKALFVTCEKELIAWAQSQPYLKRTY
jgi:hypothetical protein